MNFTTMKNVITRTVTRGVLQIKKYSPEILTATAVITGVAATATAIERTMKIDTVLGEIEHDQEKLEQMRQYKDEGVVTEEMYSEQELTQARIVYGAKAGILLLKHYRVPAALLVASVASQLGSYSILKKRYAGAVAAYMTAQTAFNAYRKQVQEKVGESEENGIFIKAMNKVEEQEKALEKKLEEAGKPKQNPYNVSQYARWFDEASRYWKKFPGANSMFIRSQEKYWNDMLRIRGHVFLNEVYDSLDIPRTTAGAVVGWVFDPEAGAPQIDFGLLDGSIERYRDFVNGREANVLLDFNVDGVIYDLI